jgi:hypothetical protein
MALASAHLGSLLARSAAVPEGDGALGMDDSRFALNSQGKAINKLKINYHLVLRKYQLN